jgi:hypothetical protein
VALTTRFTPGWPWPEESYGLEPMFGADGWCRSCGTPLREQIGPLTIQGRKFPTSSVWMPNWRFDVVCVGPEVAADVGSKFSLQMREVHKPHAGPTGHKQLVPDRGAVNWYDPTDLKAAVTDRHAKWHGRNTGAKCDACGHWRWLPISEGHAPVIGTALPQGRVMVVSPEIFGDGWNTFRHLLFRRDLAELLVSANPRSWSTRELTIH